MKSYDLYIKENVEITKPFDRHPINVYPIYFDHKKDLVLKLKEYYDKFIGRRVTVEAGIWKERYNAVQSGYINGIYTFIVKKVDYKAYMGGEAPTLKFSDKSGNTYKISKILSSMSTKSIKSLDDPYAEEDWEGDVI